MCVACAAVKTAAAGHVRSDSIMGLNRSAIGTLVDRTTRFMMLARLRREEGHHHKQVPRMGALGGYGGITMKNALAVTKAKSPLQRGAH